MLSQAERTRNTAQREMLLRSMQECCPNNQFHDDAARARFDGLARQVEQLDIRHAVGLAGLDASFAEESFQHSGIRSLEFT